MLIVVESAPGEYYRSPDDRDDDDDIYGPLEEAQVFKVSLEWVGSDDYTDGGLKLVINPPLPDEPAIDGAAIKLVEFHLR